jgi:hypothetical protein
MLNSGQDGLRKLVVAVLEIKEGWGGGSAGPHDDEVGNGDGTCIKRVTRKTVPNLAISLIFHHSYKLYVKCS